jgi:hypothetical protein
MAAEKGTLAFVLAALGLVAFAPTSGCSGSSKNGEEADAGDAGATVNMTGGFGNSSDSGIPSVSCAAGVGLQCSQVACSGGKTTTIHGTVFDPAMQVPLYNVAVYVPNSPPIPLPTGVACDCSTWFTNPLVSAVTDTNGNFTITNAPSGPNIPLIVQIGKWRMVYKLSNVAACTDNDAEALAGGKLHMPRNHTEGFIPSIAVSTGALDSLECLLMRMGVDKDEYTGDPGGDGRIHIFTGGDAPAGLGGAQTNAPVSKLSYQYLWNADASMDQYDVVILSCEGNETSFLNDDGRKVLLDYANAGGRVFASHYHYAWFNSGPFTTIPGAPPLATWSPEGNKPETVGPGNDTAANQSEIVTKLPNGMPFPEGTALHSWLGNVGALTNDKLPIWYARHNADLTAANTASQQWIALDPATTAPNAAEYFSFDTPVGSAAQACGRVVYSDLHVSGGKGAQADRSVPPDYPGSLAIVPDQCAAHPLTPQEKALEFMIFDLSSCLIPIGQMASPPK